MPAERYWIISDSFLKQLLIIQLLETILRKAMGPFAHQAYFHKRIGIVYGGIRIGDDAVQSDIFIHVAFPAFVFGFFENLNFLTTAENHVISPN